MSSSTDRIEKTTFLRAPRSRVFRAVTDSREFGQWFGVAIEGAFTPGARVMGKITMPKYTHLTMEMVIEKIEAESLFSYRWHPYALDPSVDYSKEKATLVEFTFVEKDGGTMLTVVESGFDDVPLARRAKAFEMNSGGWEMQMKNIETHLADAK